MNFELRPLSGSEFAAWDNLVLESPEGALFHQTAWLEASGERFCIYGYFKGGELCAGMPIAYQTTLKIRNAKMPSLTPYLGTVFRQRDTKYVNRISEDKEVNLELARRLKQDFTSGYFHSVPGWADLQPFIWHGFSAGVRYTYILDNKNSLEDIWKSMNDKRRNDISKAQKDGIGVVLSDDFDATYRLVEKTFARQEKTVAFRAAAFRYDAALRARKQCQAFLARSQEGEPKAVVYIVWDNKRSYYLLGGYDPEKSHHGASALAMWEAIRFTKERLCLAEFDFEGSMVPQIEQFFRKFGGRLTPYYTVSWSKRYLKLVPRRAKVAAYRVLGSFR